MARLFMLVALVAVVVAVARWLARRLTAQQRRARPGHQPSQPIAVTRFDQIDAAVAAESCPCGGPLRAVSEGSDGACRIVHAECQRCEETTDLYFDTSGIQH